MILYYLIVLSLAFVEHPIFGVSVGRITIEKVIGAAALTYALVHLMLHRLKPSFVDTAAARGFLIFFAITLWSYLTTGLHSVSGHFFGFVPFNFLLMLVITISVVDSVRRLRWTLIMAIGSIAWASLYMLREWQEGVRTYGYGYRPGYVVGDPNYFASSALLCFPLACYFARTMPERWIRWACGIAVLFILAGITVSGSRGGFIGLAVTVSMMIWHSKRRGQALILIVLVGFMLMLSPSSPLERLLHPTGSDREATSTRVILWKAAWNMFRDHPMSGVGYGNFRNFESRYITADLRHNFLVHNQYLEVLSEIGLPGLLAYCGIFIGSLMSLNRARRAARSAGSQFFFDAALGIQIGLVGFGVSVFFVSAMFLRMFWLMVSVSACLPVVLDRAVAKRRSVGDLVRDRRSVRELTGAHSPADSRVRIPGNC